MNVKMAPNIEIIDLPTTIKHLSELSKELDGPQLYIKRNEMSDNVYNKRLVRSLEKFMANAVNMNAKYVITSGNIWSSHIYLTVSTAIRFRLKPIVIIADSTKAPNDYYLLKESFGAELHFIHVDPETSKEEAVRKGNKKAKEIQVKHKSEGMTSYIIPSNIEESLAAVCDMVEISNHIKAKNLHINYIVKPVDSTYSFGVVILETKLFETGLTPIGICVANKANKFREKTLNSVSKLGFDSKIKDEEINIFNSTASTSDYPKELGVKAMQLLAGKEAIFLDHDHNGKALAGLFNLINHGYFKKDDGVLFLHSGEFPALSALHHENVE